MTNQTLQALLKKQEQITARIKALKTKEISQLRKDETRKKILAGSYLLEKTERENSFEALKEGLDKFLTRKNDRALFGLE